MKEDIIWSKDEHFLTLLTDVTSQELPSLSDPKASPPKGWSRKLLALKTPNSVTRERVTTGARPARLVTSLTKQLLAQFFPKGDKTSEALWSLNQRGVKPNTHSSKAKQGKQTHNERERQRQNSASVATSPRHLEPRRPWPNKRVGHLLALGAGSPPVRTANRDGDSCGPWYL